MMRWVGHVAPTAKKRNIHNVLRGKLEERDHLEDIGMDRSMILKRILNNKMVAC
jgi:hypothetical protein